VIDKMIFAQFGVLILLFSNLVQAKPQYGTVTVSKVISVYDGDTFRVNIDSLPPIVGKNIPIRVDTPEMPGKCQYEKDLALEAKGFLELNWLMLKRLS
jgi:endonuclease YncB( thermonuclease family)